MARLRSVGSVVGRVLLGLFWILMTAWMIGVAEWDGRAEPGDGPTVAMMLATAVGCGALLAGAWSRPPTPRRIAIAALVVWLVTLVALYSG
jgi:hypothetical protein